MSVKQVCLSVIVNEILHLSLVWVSTVDTLCLLLFGYVIGKQIQEKVVLYI